MHQSGHMLRKVTSPKLYSASRARRSIRSEVADGEPAGAARVISRRWLPRCEMHTLSVEHHVTATSIDVPLMLMLQLVLLLLLLFVLCS